VIAHKFLSRGAVGLYSGFRWPTPEGGEPGSWVMVTGPLVAGSNGVHACDAGALADWLDDELWLVELDDQCLRADGLLVARRGRLLRRLEEWNERTAEEFAHACVLSAREYACAMLEEAGATEEAEAIRRSHDLDELQKLAASSSIDVDSESLVLLADSVELARGGRPERYGSHPAIETRPSAAALAANLGFVAAHAAGTLEVARTGDPSVYETAHGDERARQGRWLAERLPPAKEARTQAERSPERTS
jgi:hypothetical protein